ncbi:FecR domain-containing protein [Magnetococcales bacterium HHB-1]
MFPRLSAYYLSLFLLLIISPLKAEDLSSPHQNILLKTVGTVTYAKGGCAAVYPASSRKLLVGSKVFAGDRLVTNPKAHMIVLMRDGSTLTLKESSRLDVNVLNQENGKSTGLFRFHRGAMLASVGHSSKEIKTSYRIMSKFAEISLNRAQFWLADTKENALALVLIGGDDLSIRNSYGRTRLDKINHGVTIFSSRKNPTPSERWDDKKIYQIKRMNRL